MIYSVSVFNHSCKQLDVEAFYFNQIRPYLQKKGIQSRLLGAQVSLSNWEYWFVISEKEFNFSDLWFRILSTDQEGQEILQEWKKMISSSSMYAFLDLEPNIVWFRKPGKYYHMECFNVLASGTEFEKFLLYECLSYWRKRGFFAKAFKRLCDLGPAEYWLVTEMDSIGSIDKWPEMATSEPEGVKHMQKLLEYADRPLASVIRDLTE